MTGQDNKCELLGVYGDDLTIACSAWTSTSRDLTTEKLARVPKLLTTLATEGHHTPFEKSTLHFLVTTEIATHIQIIKHRIGVSFNGESARYKELKDDKFYLPTDWDQEQLKEYEEFMQLAYDKYHKTLNALIAKGMPRKRAKESARFYLPYGNQITADVSFNFRSFMHFQGLRNEEHAQDEIKFLAQNMLQLVKETGKFNASLAAFGY